MAFGVATGNPFALLGGDEENDDPQKIMLPPQEALEVKSDQPPEGEAPARGGELIVNGMKILVTGMLESSGVKWNRFRRVFCTGAWWQAVFWGTSAGVGVVQ